MATSVGAREGHSSAWGGRVVGGEEQAAEGSNVHLSGSQGGSQQWMGWASSWGWLQVMMQEEKLTVHSPSSNSFLSFLFLFELRRCSRLY